MEFHNNKRQGRSQGIDLAASVCNGLALSLLLFQAFLKYSDPLYDDSTEENTAQQNAKNVANKSTESRFTDDAATGNDVKVMEGGVETIYLQQDLV